jgi:hypothetical protein
MKKYLITTLVFCLTVLLSSCEYLEDIISKPPAGKTQTFTAFLSGDQEVADTPVQASGAGQGIFTLNAAGTEISYKLLVSNTEKIKFAHIHLAPKGENGQVVAFLLQEQVPSTGLVNGLLAEGKIRQADLVGPLAGKPLADLVKALSDGTAYANIHTDKYPAGELRGQISKQVEQPSNEFTAVLTGSQEVPPVTTDASGVALLYFDHHAKELRFRVDVAKLKDPLFSHIHLAPVGANGGVIANLRLDKLEGEVNGKYAEGTIKEADLVGNLKGGSLSILKEAMERGYTYVNIHTDKNRPGEIRGQIR